MFSTNSTTRRSFLRTSVGGILSLPFLETFAAAKATATAPPTRAIFLGGGFGFTQKTFYPTKAGKFAEIGMTEGMAPLTRHLNDITMVSNMTNIGASDPHGGSSTYLTGANQGAKNSISCDQLLAEKLGKDTRYQSLILSAKEKDGGSNSGHGSGFSLSWDELGNPIPGITSPLDLYNKLFANASDSKEAVNERLKREQSILDLVKLNGSSVKRQLSKMDQEKLDEYFTGIRQIEKSIEREAKWADIPKPKAGIAAPGSALTGEQAIHAMYDLLIIALQTDATRIASYRLPVCDLLTGMGIKLGAHSLSHYGFSKARIAASKVRDVKCSSLLAHFIDRLKQAKDIDGSSLYDNCIVSYGSNLRSGHQINNVPAILTGGGAKKIKHGKHIILPEANTPLANYWLTIMQQAGVNADKFSHSTGIVPQLISA